MNQPVTVAALILAGLASSAVTAAFAAAAMPIVAELYTSQGCNSCPPADALLGELTREPDVIALAFHVQYWDGLGWSDRFGMPEAARRQNLYVQRRQLSGSFTPQLILNGEHSLVGSNRSQVLAVVKVLRTQAAAGVAIATSFAANRMHIALPVTPGMARATDVLLLPLLSQADSVIGRGENGGRTLREYHIVRGVKLLGSWQGAALQFDVPLTALPRDADRVALLVQEKNQGALRGAALVALPRK
jgi:hypothetical protein